MARLTQQKYDLTCALMKLGFEIHSGNEHLLFAAVDAYAVARESREIAELKAQIRNYELRIDSDAVELDKRYSERTELNAEIKRLRDGIKKGFEKLAEIPYCSVLRTIFDNAKGVQDDLESLLSPAPVTEGKEIKTYKCNKCGVVVKADGKPLVCVRHVTFRTSGVCGGAFNEITLNEDYHE